MARKPLSKKKRFEVFKRDKFKCTYCGAAAPEVILHVDHIKPVSKGGTNSILNLTTSCKDCNSGKSNRELSDDSVVAKKRTQLEEMQERKELIEMMVDWELGFGDELDAMVDGLEKIFQQTINNENKIFTDSYRSELKVFFKKYSFSDVVQAFRDSCSTYLKWDGDQTQDESRNKALTKLGGVLRVNEEDKLLPGSKRIGLIYGRIKRSYNYTPAYWKVSSLIKDALENGVRIDDIESMQAASSNWTQFNTLIESAINPEVVDHA